MIKKLCDSLDCKNDKFRFIAPNACIILADFLWVRSHFGGLTHEKSAFCQPTKGAFSVMYSAFAEREAPSA